MRYFSHETLLDYDLVLWEPQHLFSELGDAYRSSFDEIFFARKGQFKRFFELGRTLVIFVPAPISLQPIEGLGGRFDLSQFIPVRMETVAQTGSLLEFRGHGVLSTMWKAIEPFVKYRAFIHNGEGQPFVFAKDSEHVIAAIIPVGTGRVLALPKLVVNSQDEDLDWATIVDSLWSFDSSIRGTFAEPAKWTQKYVSPGEELLREQLASLQENLKVLTIELETISHSLEDEVAFKHLLSGSGDELVRQVIRAFETLGIEARAGLAGRDDIRLDYGSRPGVAEVKGVSGSAAEKHAAQLEKFLCERREQGEETKGFLIVNAFATSPLDERTGDPFPPQMVPFCVKREHCLLTTSQLYELVLEVRADPSRATGIRESLWNSIGVFQHASISTRRRD